MEAYELVESAHAADPKEALKWAKYYRELGSRGEGSMSEYFSSRDFGATNASAAAWWEAEAARRQR